VPASSSPPIVLIVGSGGREHAIADALSRAESAPRLITAPGNPGTASLGENVPIGVTDVDGLVELAKTRAVDLVVVGPEAPLVAGLSDRLREAGVLVVGPSRAAAELEGSKTFAKQVMDDGAVPTASWVAPESVEEARAFIERHEGRVAVKADGLAGGKGVVVCDDVASASAALADLETRGVGGGKVMIEQRLEGEELSVIALTDGDGVVLMAPSQDHKRVGEGDTGPNTGGMGAYAPAPKGTETLLADIEARCIRPVLKVMADRGTPFSGVLYAGLMLTEDGPKVLEYNVRFGDPEAQVILPLLGEDAYLLLRSVAEGTVQSRAAKRQAGAALTVVLASEGYPVSPRKGDAIEGLVAVDDEDVIVFQAGTKVGEGGALVTAGGRVLAVTGLGDDLAAAAAKAYDSVSKIGWAGEHHRRDIGWRAGVKPRS